MGNKLIWEDNTTYCQGETDRIPRVWQAKINRLRISVHRHRDFKLDTWLISCEPFFNLHILKNSEVESAKEEALILITNVLTAEIEFLRG